MTKQEFMVELRKKLSGIPKQDVEERLNFYGEMIDDRIEEGRTDEEAVLAIGSVEQIYEQIITEISFTKIAKERVKPPRRLKAWEIVLLALGSPIWLSLAVAAFAVILAIYISLWAVIVSLWVIFAALTVCLLYGVVTGIVLTLIGNGLVGLATFGAGLVCGGLAIFMFFGCLAATKGTVIITPKIVLGIKKCFIKKEEAK